MRSFVLSLLCVACTDSGAGRVEDAADVVDTRDDVADVDDTSAPLETSDADASPSEAAQHAAECLRHWVGDPAQGIVDFEDLSAVPVVHVVAFDAANLAVTLELSWYDTLVAQEVTLVASGEHAGHLHLAATPPQDGTFGTARIPLDLRFDGTCAALLGTARRADRTGAFVVTRALRKELQRDALDGAVFDRDEIVDWASSALAEDGTSIALSVPELGDTPITLAWDGGVFAGLSDYFPDDGDATRVTLALAPDGRAAALEADQALSVALTHADARSAIASCLRSGTFAGWLFFDGAPRAVTVAFDNDLALRADDPANNIVHTVPAGAGTIVGQGLAIDQAAYVPFGDMLLAVAHDCSAAWVAPRTGPRGAGFLFRR